MKKNSFFYYLHRIDKHVEKGEFSKINREAWFGLIPIALSRALPVAISLFFGNEVVNLILKYAPEWLMGGLKLAGAVLPVVGIAILLRYLPVKKFFAYLIIGFLLAAYLQVPMMGIALAGLAFALIHYRKLQDGHFSATANGQATINEGEVDDDEI